MVDLRKDRADTDKLRDGAWVSIPDFGDVKIRRWRNKEHSRELVRLSDRRREELKLKPDEDLSEDDSLAVAVESACRTIIVDWRGITSDDEPVPYTPETAMEVFNDDSWSDIFPLIVNASAERQNYLEKKKEGAVKNA